MWDEPIIHQEPFLDSWTRQRIELFNCSPKASIFQDFFFVQKEIMNSSEEKKKEINTLLLDKGVISCILIPELSR